MCSHTKRFCQIRHQTACRLSLFFYFVIILLPYIFNVLHIEYMPIANDSRLTDLKFETFSFEAPVFASNFRRVRLCIVVSHCANASAISGTRTGYIRKQLLIIDPQMRISIC